MINTHAVSGEILRKIVRNSAPQGLTRREAAEALALLEDNPALLLDLFSLTRPARQDAPAPFTCGIINAKSGLCTENCAFCAQSAHHDTGAPVYPLVGEAALLERAALLAGRGVDYMGIVISGTGPSDGDFERICRAARRIIDETGIKLCASLGLIGPEQALRLKEAGFTSYHHNLETAPSFYPQICDTHDIGRRCVTVRNARAAGLRCCSGGIFGLGESWEQRLELSALLAELEVDSIPVNLLNAIKGTPLENAPKLPPREALTIIALLRLMHPARDIVICGGRSHNLGRWESLIFPAGANGVMVGDYLVSKNNPMEQDLEMLEVLGLRHGRL
jgi:biotin synthase